VMDEQSFLVGATPFVLSLDYRGNWRPDSVVEIALDLQGRLVESDRFSVADLVAHSWRQPELKYRL